MEDWRVPITWADAIKSVKQRQWTINEAWALISSSAAAKSGLHPDVHAVFPEHPGASDHHFLTREDHQGEEYRDRPRALRRLDKMRLSG